MARLRKKGESGYAAAFISRSRAIKKLQLSLANFRRLCILKGVYPRDPPNLKKVLKAAPGKGGSNQTFYAVKDIQFLAHEPLLAKFREEKIWLRRVKRWQAKGDDKGRDLSGPEYSLDHLVRERYPTFMDALKDLDDVLSMLALFALLPTPTISSKASRARIQWSSECARLIREWEAVVMATGSLVCSFISIRGIYHRAIVYGQLITWIVPHERPIDVPTDVDFKVMLTFVEFYVALLGFMNYRLFASLGWHYPLLDAPTITPSTEKSLNTTKLESSSILISSTLPRIAHESEYALQSQILPPSTPRIFTGMIFWIGRECPIKSLSFIIQCLGGSIAWENSIHANSPFEEKDTQITHQIADRPSISIIYADRIYIQPQWVFDCLNAKKVLEWQPYSIGTALPPHRSPFVKNEPEGTSLKQETMTDEQRQLAASVLSKKQRKVYQRVKASKDKRVAKEKRFAVKPIDRQ